MPFALSAGGVVSVLSGVALAVLGLVVLRVRPRTRATVAFSVFSALWGAQIVVANLGAMSTDLDQAAALTLLFLVLVIPLYIPLLYFVVVHPSPPRRLPAGPVWLGLLAAPAVGLLLLLSAAPQLFVQAVVARADAPGLFRAQIGPLFEPVTTGNAVLAFAIALAAVTAKLRRALGGAERDQLGLLAAAFLAYVAYRASDLLSVLFLGGAAFLAPGGLAAQATRLVADLAALGTALGVATLAVRRRDLPWRDLALACAAVPFVFGVGEAVLVQAGVRGFSTVGVWRLLMVALFAYAIARHRMFDVEVRLRSAAPVALYGTAAFAGAGALWYLAPDILLRAPALGLLATVGLVAALVPVGRLGGRAVAARATQLDDPEYLYQRKVQVYRTNLEEALADGDLEPWEDKALTALRRGLGITEREHKLLLLMAKSEERRRAPAQSLVQGTRFRVERELGRGGFARALLARDTVLDRLVVLKQPLAPWVFEDEGKQRFLQEARLAAQVRHPNVVAIHDVLDEQPSPSIVFEYVPGGDLADLMARRGKMRPAEAARIILDVLAGLGEVHRAGIVHRDVKPANVLIDASGRALVTDFGIAHPPVERAGATTLATQGVQPGSLPFMSPEQARGEPVDARTDLYAVAVILYRMLTGQHYIELGREDEFDFKLRARIQRDPPRLPSADVPPALEGVLVKALAKDPAGRFPVASEMARAVREAVGAPAEPAGDASAAPPSPPTEASRPAPGAAPGP